MILEGWPIIVLLFALVIEFRHIASSSWLQIFLYNGDSLTLPLLRQTLAHKEPFLWVSSSQFLLFPESLFYAVSSLIAKSIRASLVFNGALNVIVLYVLFRWIAGTIAKTARYLKQLFALGCCLLLVFYMLLERQAYVNSSSVATLFIFTSYYYGVIISGAALIGILLRQIKSSSALIKLSGRQLTLASLALLISGLATFSNPIFIVQFIFPLLLSLGIVFLCNGLRLKHTILTGLPMLTGCIIGYTARLPLKAFVGVSLGSHIITKQIPATLTTFHQAISQDLHSKSGLLELVLVCGIIAFSVIYTGWWVYQRARHPNKPLDGRLFLLSTFAVIEPSIVILFSIATGSMVTRYLLPLFIFPMLGLLPVLTSKPVARFSKVLVAAAALIILITVVIGATAVGKARYVLSSSSYTDAACLAAALHNQPAFGVGGYWTVRPLDVYSRADEQALQVSSDLSPFAWQSNLGSYENKEFSFIIVDNKVSTDIRAVPASDPAIPANPSRVYNCDDMHVYIYTPGTSGYNQLNSALRNDYSRLVKARAAGNILQSY
jgi:hypothetical protein